MSREEFWLDNYKNLYNNGNYKKFIPRIQTRDGGIVSFDFNKIVNAI